jgi:DNA-binding IclR family transcriptional regulator
MLLARNVPLDVKQDQDRQQRQTVDIVERLTTSHRPPIRTDLDGSIRRISGYVDVVPGSIQSIERAAAILRTLATGAGPLRLAEISASLKLAKGTAHGLLRTLTEVGFVEQDRGTGRYRLGDGLSELRSHRLDPNELRARSMNWADPLAARSGEAVRVVALVGIEVLVVHYVFRPDHSPQRADVGATVPIHATALGKALLAHSPGLQPLLRTGELTSYTSRTVTDPNRLAAELLDVRARGYALEFGEHLPDQAGIAAAVLGPGGLPVGAVGIHGDLDRLCDAARGARPRLVAQVIDCARVVGRDLQISRAGG